MPQRYDALIGIAKNNSVKTLKIVLIFQKSRIKIGYRNNISRTHNSD